MPSLTPDECHKLCEEACAAINAPHFGRAKMVELERTLARYERDGDSVVTEALGLLVLTARSRAPVQGLKIDDVQRLIETAAKSAGPRQYNNGNGTMANDSYSATGQIGAQGPHAHAHDINFQQVWASEGSTINLPAAAGELGRLVEELRVRSKSPEEFSALAAVSQAAASASKGDGGGMLKHLASAGKWTFDVAKEIGIEVAAAAIAKSMGLPG